MWKASADYKDGTYIEREFEYDETVPEFIQQSRIAMWLLDQHENPVNLRVELICK